MPSDRPDRLPRVCSAGVPLATAGTGGQQYCAFRVRYCRRGVVLFFFPFFFFFPNGIWAPSYLCTFDGLLLSE